jgi:hypothetical protein
MNKTGSWQTWSVTVSMVLEISCVGILLSTFSSPCFLRENPLKSAQASKRKQQKRIMAAVLEFYGSKTERILKLRSSL